MAKIQDIKSREILDSRGQPTVETTVVLEDGSTGIASIPSGASKGKYEALELRDNDPNRYLRMGVLKAVENVETKIKEAVLGHEAGDQEGLDNLLHELDGTENFSSLGANATLSVSVATALAEAKSEKISPYLYFQKIAENKNKLFLPTPLCNVINGGEHASNNLEFQEFMIVPMDEGPFSERIRKVAEVYQSLKQLLLSVGYSTSVGDEGGFAPVLRDNYEALTLLAQAVKMSGQELGREIMLALDVAANSFYDRGELSYRFKSEETTRSGENLIKYYSKLLLDFPIISIEDPLAESDITHWKKMTDFFGAAIQIVGDDFFVTNSQKLKKGIEEGLANTILIKPNQIGTISDTLGTINLAKQSGYGFIVSHRSGETEETWIADFAVGVGSKQVKFGSLSRSERIAKYNRLMQIENELKI